MIGRLAAGVAHDINNHLSAALLSMSFAERQGLSESAAAELRAARTALAGIGRLVESLVAYARGTTPPATQVDLTGLVRRTLEAFGSVVPDNVDVEIETYPAVPHVRGVETELEQLVLNLVLNACQAMPFGGTLYLIVSLLGEAGLVRLEVIDTGGGMLDEAVAATGPLTVSSHAGRVGLGLGIVRAVVERHAGTLHIHRTDRGSSVVVGLPRV